MDIGDKVFYPNMIYNQYVVIILEIGEFYGILEP